MLARGLGVGAPSRTIYALETFTPKKSVLGWPSAQVSGVECNVLFKAAACPFCLASSAAAPDSDPSLPLQVVHFAMMQLTRQLWDSVAFIQIIYTYQLCTSYALRICSVLSARSVLFVTVSSVF